MIRIIIVFFVLIIFVRKASAKEYIFKGYAVSKQETINISNNHKFSSYTSQGMWDDSNGDYGSERCSGYVKQINKKVDLEVYCETINQNNEIFWNSRIRRSDKGGGIGEMTILNATGKYKNLIGLSRPYGITYKDDYAWFRAKCIIKSNK